MKKFNFSPRSPSCLTVLALFVCLAAGCAMGPKHVVSVGPTQVAYVSHGDSSPAIVLESGMGNGMESWEPVYKKLAKTNRVFAYSRPGYSRDLLYRWEPDQKRTSRDVASMLRKVLQNAEIPPPYLLVGHLIGGAYMLCFAGLYPDEVAGIVLLDARLKNFRDRCEAAGFDLCSPPQDMALTLPPPVREEFRGLKESELEIPEPEELGAIPITVISATEPPYYASRELQDLWLEVQSDFARSLADGRFVRAEGLGHYIHRENPELVINEIETLVARVRGQNQNP